MLLIVPGGAIAGRALKRGTYPAGAHAVGNGVRYGGVGLVRVVLGVDVVVRELVKLVLVVPAVVPLVVVLMIGVVIVGMEVVMGVVGLVGDEVVVLLVELVVLLGGVVLFVIGGGKGSKLKFEILVGATLLSKIVVIADINEIRFVVAVVAVVLLMCICGVVVITLGFKLTTEYEFVVSGRIDVGLSKRFDRKVESREFGVFTVVVIGADVVVVVGFRVVGLGVVVVVVVVVRTVVSGLRVVVVVVVVGFLVVVVEGTKN